MHTLIPINDITGIPKQYRKTPIELLIEYHNFKKPYDEYSAAQLLIGMCMDNRKSLNIPNNFAFILRAGGANLRQSEFKISYAVGVGGIRCIALIGHTQCGMVNIVERKEQFTDGLVSVGWEKTDAEKHFEESAPIYEIRNATDFILNETIRLRIRYPKVIVAPLLYRVEDNLLYLIDESMRPKG